MGVKDSTRKLTTMAVLTAISIVLVYFIHVPIIPGVNFLEYDPADIPILIGTFLMGSSFGLILTAVVSVLQWLLVSQQSGPIGALMHFLATGSFALTVGLLKKKHNEILALACGALAMTSTMVVWNLIFTPLFLSIPISEVAKMLIPAIIPFNIIKSGLNAIISFFIYKGVKKFYCP